MGGNFSALEVAHGFIARHLRPGGFCIDATAGRGRDTAFLCGLTGETGRVVALDIQEEAVRSTNELLLRSGLGHIGRAVLDSHRNIAAYAREGEVDCIVFNFGWLPGGDHSIQTKPETSIAAVAEGLRLLREGGIMSLCIYSGGESGFAERDALLAFLPTLDPQRYTVVVSEFVNRGGNPPIPVCIIKDS